MEFFLHHPQHDRFNWNDILFLSHTQIKVFELPSIFVCLTVFRVLEIYNSRRPRTRKHQKLSVSPVSPESMTESLCGVRSLECCTPTLSTSWTHMSGLVNKMPLQPGHVIRIDLYKLSDINKEFQEKEREDLTERAMSNKYIFIYKESPERDLLTLSSEIRIKLTRATTRKLFFY